MTSSESTINERLASIRREYKIRQIEVEQETGIKQSTLSKIEHGRQDAPQELLLFYNRKYKVSIDWMLTGTIDINEGEFATGLSSEDYLRENYKNKNPASGHGTNAKNLGNIHEHELIELPFVPVAAHATFAENCYDSIRREDFGTRKVMRIEDVDYRGVILIEIKGNSMGGRYSAGTIVMARPVPRERWHIASGVHAISIKNEFIVKRIKDNGLSVDGKLLLHSDNQEYGSATVETEDIMCMWKVGEIVYAPAE